MAPLAEHVTAKAWDGDGVPLADSNCAEIGSDADKAARKSAAQTEEAWKGVGQEVGLQVWRIEQFKVKAVPKQEYGNFYSGDSYIILETSKESDSPKLTHHIFFWLGKETTTDEMGTAAYKTVELDDFFDGSATQSREVQEQESSQFRALFKAIHYHDGGVESGFHSVGVDVYESRLFHIRRQDHHDGMRIKQVPRGRDSLNEGDCFVLDAADKIYVWTGKDAKGAEKLLASQYADKLETEREGKAKKVLDVDETFWELLGGEGPIKAASEAVDEGSLPFAGECVLYKLTDTDKELKCTEVARGELGLSMLESKAVMLLDACTEICLWVGKDADELERRNAMPTAANFLRVNAKPIHTPIHLYKEGSSIKSLAWKKAFAAGAVAKKPDAPQAQQPKPAEAAKAPVPTPAGAPLFTEAKHTAEAAVAREEAAAANPNASILTLDELTGDAWRQKGVPPSRREQYLSDAEFKAVFEMSKDEFNALPKWKSDGLKKKHNLF